MASATLSVIKWSGALFRSRSSKVSAAKNLLCPFHCKPRPSGVSLESPGLPYISQEPQNRTKVDQNHDARNAVSATVSVKVKWGYISGQKPESERSKCFAVFFDWKTRPSRVTLASLRLENIPQVPVNRAEVGQNHDAPKAVSATVSVLKWSGAIFLSRSSKVSVQKVLLCAFHYKPKLSKVSLGSPGLTFDSFGL